MTAAPQTAAASQRLASVLTKLTKLAQPRSCLPWAHPHACRQVSAACAAWRAKGGLAGAPAAVGAVCKPAHVLLGDRAGRKTAGGRVPGQACGVNKVQGDQHMQLYTAALHVGAEAEPQCVCQQGRPRLPTTKSAHLWPGRWSAGCRPWCARPVASGRGSCCQACAPLPEPSPGSLCRASAPGRHRRHRRRQHPAVRPGHSPRQTGAWRAAALCGVSTKRDWEVICGATGEGQSASGSGGGHRPVRAEGARRQPRQGCEVPWQRPGCRNGPRSAGAACKQR